MKEYSPEIKKQLKKLRTFDEKPMQSWVSKAATLFVLACIVALFFMVDLVMAFYGCCMMLHGSVLTHVNYVVDPRASQKNSHFFFWRVFAWRVV